MKAQRGDKGLLTFGFALPANNGTYTYSIGLRFTDTSENGQAVITASQGNETVSTGSFKVRRFFASSDKTDNVQAYAPFTSNPIGAPPLCVFATFGPSRPQIEIKPDASICMYDSKNGSQCNMDVSYGCATLR
jgi:hypothetical protein